jgi:hypothetical protein
MAVDLSAIAKWPNVPACYDWLSLDRRGDWRLQGDRVTHQGFIALLNRQYGVDDRGCWFVQNGPQRVFVELAYTPWIFRREGEAFVSHTSEAAGEIKAVFLDEEGSILLESALGIGLLDDRDLTQFLAECRDNTGQVADEDGFIALMQTGKGNIRWQSLTLQIMAVADIPGRYHFNPQPQP